MLSDGHFDLWPAEKNVNEQFQLMSMIIYLIKTKHSNANKAKVFFYQKLKNPYCNT